MCKFFLDGRNVVPYVINQWKQANDERRKKKGTVRTSKYIISRRKRKKRGFENSSHKNLAAYCFCTIYIKLAQQKFFFISIFCLSSSTTKKRGFENSSHKNLAAYYCLYDLYKVAQQVFFYLDILSFIFYNTVAKERTSTVQ